MVNGLLIAMTDSNGLEIIMVNYNTLLIMLGSGTSHSAKATVRPIFVGLPPHRAAPSKEWACFLEQRLGSF